MNVPVDFACIVTEIAVFLTGRCAWGFQLIAPLVGILFLTCLDILSQALIYVHVMHKIESLIK